MLTLPFLFYGAYHVFPERKAAVPNIEHQAIEDLINNLNPYKPGYDVKKIHDTVRDNPKLGEVILSSSKTCDTLINITYNSSYDRNLRLHAMWTLGLSGLYSNHSSKIGKIRNIITVLKRDTNDTHLIRAANWTLGNLAHVTSPETKISNMINSSLLIGIISVGLFSKSILAKQLKNENENDLMKACRNGDMTNFSDLINRHDVNAINKNGATALMMAAQDGYTECVKALIQAKASVDQGRTSDGITPLFVAALNGHEDCVKALIQANASIDQRMTSDGITPLFVAVCNGYTDCVKALIQAKASIDQGMTSDEITPLIVAAQDGYTDCVKALIQAKASVDQGRTSDGITPLFVAAFYDHKDCVRILLGEKITISKDLEEDDKCLISHVKLSDDINDLCRFNKHFQIIYIFEHLFEWIKENTHIKDKVPHVINPIDPNSSIPLHDLKLVAISPIE